jgi:bifunctional non-homologous end joining protein LigD
MPMNLPTGAVPSSMLADVRLQIVTPCKRPPSGGGWLHEIKHDGHRLVAIVPGDGQLMLLSRNGYDRTRLFREPFRPLIDAKLPAMVLDGEIAVPDDRGVTHLDALSDAISGRDGFRGRYADRAFSCHVAAEITPPLGPSPMLTR